MDPNRRAALLALLVLALAPLSGCGGSSRVRAPARSASRVFSPYLDVTLDSSKNLPAAAQRAGLRSLTLAFVDGVGRACRASWEGSPLAQVVPPTTVGRLRATGTDTTVSFGGRDGPELAQVCRTPRALTARYQAVIDAYGLTRVDFDLEGAALADRATNQRRWRAITALQAAARSAGRPLAVWLTLPVSTTGLTPEGLATLRDGLAAGVRPALINLLAMDYGPDFPSTLTRSMSSYARVTATDAVAQLGKLYPGTSAAQRWALTGITPMVGVNDVTNEVFTVQDAAALLTFARDRGAGGLSMWSLSRDQPCPPGTAPRAQPTCSGVGQSALAFARAFGGSFR